MKKLLLTALISTSIFGLAACGGKDKDEKKLVVVLLMYRTLLF